MIQHLITALFTVAGMSALTVIAAHIHRATRPDSPVRQLARMVWVYDL